jgi:hypothetical protein
MSTTLYSFGEFKEQQGMTGNNDALWIGNRWLLANGAQSDGEYTHRQPPVDGPDLLNLLLEFCRHKLKLAEKKFTHTQEYIREAAEFKAKGAGPGPAEAAFTELGMFQEIVVETRKQIAIYTKQRQQVSGPDRFEQIERQRADNRAAANDAINRAMAFQI